MIYTNTAAFASAGAAPPAQAFLIDDVGQSALSAVSVRKLKSDYSGFCMRIRRQSDNAETDIGFDAVGMLDVQAIATFCGTARGFVKTWYDQSGNSAHYTNSVISTQPYIYQPSTGGVFTDALGNYGVISTVNTATVGPDSFLLSINIGRYTPTTTMVGQINLFNSSGLMFCDDQNGYFGGTYGTPSNNSVRLISSSGGELISIGEIQTNGTEPFHFTTFYARPRTGVSGFYNSRLWSSSRFGTINSSSGLDVPTTINPLEWAIPSPTSYNTPDYDRIRLFSFPAGNHGQNCIISEFINWDFSTEMETLLEPQIAILQNNINTQYGLTLTPQL